MAILLLAAFIGIPILEIAIFIEVGSRIGVLPTVTITIATAVAGTLLLRAQGLATLERARAQLDRGELPKDELFDGLCLLIAGACLLTPGFFTDVLGLLLFIPPFRQFLRRFFAAYVRRSGRARVIIDGEELRPGERSRQAGKRGTVIDAEYTEIVDEDFPSDRSLDDRSGPERRG